MYTYRRTPVGGHSFRALLVVLVVIFVRPSLAVGDSIYVFKEPDGTIRFTTKPPPKGTRAEVFAPGKGNYTRLPLLGNRGAVFPEKYRSIIEKHSKHYGVERALVQAVIHAESAFNKRAVSPKGALGLMQLMPFNLDRLGVEDPFSPDENIQGGVRLLSMLQKRYRGNLRLSLAAYNAGEDAVERYAGVPPYRETRLYVQKVLGLYQRYRLL